MTSVRAKQRVIALVERFGLLGVLVIVIAAFAIALPGLYLTPTNLQIVLSGQAVLLMLALGVTLPLRAGEFDLSIGSVVVGSATLVAALTVNHGVPLAPAVLAALVAGLVIGSIHAITVVGLGVNAFIATLGTMTFVLGLTLAVSDGEVIAGVPDELRTFADTEVWSLPLSVYYAWGLALILWYVYEFTPFGRRLLFTGGNPAAAQLTGIRVKRIRTLAFLGSSLVAAAAGVVLVGTLAAVDPNTGASYLLQPYAAAFLGTAVLQFGRFNALGTVIGLYLLASGVSGLQLLGVQTWVTDVFNGGVLVLAVVVATLMRRGALSAAGGDARDARPPGSAEPATDATGEEPESAPLSR